LGLLFFAREPPREAVIANWVQTVDSPAAAVKRARKCSHFESAPTNSVRALQDYYRRVSTRRGWDEETPALILEYLQKELDELKRAMTLTAGGTIVVDGEDPDLELADIVLYAMHLANVRELDLSRSIVEKERINAQRFDV
jgi:NTP pyrophosphatase (non-canonical NTP hydrolase)